MKGGRHINMVLDLDYEKAKREIIAKAQKAYRGIYQADLTDDCKVLQLHWALGEMTNVPLQHVLDAYLDSLGCKRVAYKKK